MRRTLLLLPWAAALLWTLSAQESPPILDPGGTPIPISNPGFEDDKVSCAVGATCDIPKITGWQLSGSAGTLKPGTAAYPVGIPEGVKVAYVGKRDGSAGSISQTLNVTVAANKTYTLKISVGQRKDEPFPGYVTALEAGGVRLAYNDLLIPPAGTFLDDVIVYEAGPHPPQLGQRLTIFIQSRGAGLVNIDDVSLSVH